MNACCRSSRTISEEFPILPTVLELDCSKFFVRYPGRIRFDPLSSNVLLTGSGAFALDSLVSTATRNIDSSDYLVPILQPMLYGLSWDGD